MLGQLAGVDMPSGARGPEFGESYPEPPGLDSLGLSRVSRLGDRPLLLTHCRSLSFG
jgi:hypothetical protein